MRTGKFHIALRAQGGSDWAGGSQYISNLLRSLNALPINYRSKIHLSFVLQAESETQPFAEIIPLADSVVREPFVPPALGLRLLPRKWFYRIFRVKHLLRHYKKMFSTQPVDFFYPIMPDAYDRLPFKYAAWVPDLQHCHLPEFFTSDEIGSRNLQFQHYSRNAEHMVVSSHAVAADLMKHFKPYDSKTPVDVLHFHTLAQKEWFSIHPSQIQKKYNLPERFFLISNQLWKHKNHQIVLSTLKDLKAQGIHPNLVCTGPLYDRRNPRHTDDLIQFVYESGLQSQVHFLGMLPRLEQIQLARQSIAMIQPSLCEGWSTVVEDCRVLGKKLLLSDLEVHREQNPPGAIFFDPKNSVALSNYIQQLWKTSDVGPDLESEKIAGIQAELNVKNFALRFLEIAGFPFDSQAPKLRNNHL